MILTPLLSRINATLIGSGTVDNTEFGFLGGVTDFIQDQLNARPEKASGAGVEGYLLAWDGSGKLADSAIKCSDFLDLSGLSNIGTGGVNYLSAVGGNEWKNVPSGGSYRWLVNNSNLARLGNTGLAIGTNGSAASALLHSQGTGVQQRLAYSDTVYYTTQVNSTGIVLQTTTGNYFNWYSSVGQIAELVGVNGGTAFTLFDRTNDGTPYCRIEFKDVSTLAAQVGFLNSGTAFALRNFLGDIFLLDSSGATKFRLSTTGTAVNGNSPVAKAAAISSPAADVAELKTAVDAIRTAIANFGITA